MTIDAEDFAEVVFVDVFGKLLYNDLQRIVSWLLEFWARKA